jgi:hypothetical protein
VRCGLTGCDCRHMTTAASPQRVKEPPIEICDVIVRPAESREDTANRPSGRCVVGAVRNMLLVAGLVCHTSSLNRCGFHRQW